MTTFDQPPIDFDAVSEPISGETKATVELVGNDWRSDRDWQLFVAALTEVSRDFSGEVNPDNVRAWLTGRNGLLINPRRLSAFYQRATKTGLLAFSHWGINGDHKGRNAGRPARIYKLRSP